MSLHSLLINLMHPFWKVLLFLILNFWILFMNIYIQYMYVCTVYDLDVYVWSIYRDNLKSHPLFNSHSLSSLALCLNLHFLSSVNIVSEIMNHKSIAKKWGWHLHSTVTHTCAHKHTHTHTHSLLADALMTFDDMGVVWPCRPGWKMSFEHHQQNS